MANRTGEDVVRSIKTLLDVGTFVGLSDSQLLERYLLRRDDAANAAFTTLVERHGPMVLRTCCSVLRDAHAAEDAFQATFLILAKKASSIRQWDSVASWLFGVARRVAIRAAARDKRRATHESPDLALLDGAAETPRRECFPEIQEEVDRLPERYRAPIVLCYLEGLTNAEAASRLRLPASTVRVRLLRARSRLRDRLIRRGLAPAALGGLAAGRVHAALPSRLVVPTVEAAMSLAAGRGAGVSTTVTVLVQGVIRAMFIAKLKFAATLLAALMLVSLLIIAPLAVPAQTKQNQDVAKQPVPAPTGEKAKSEGHEVREVNVANVVRGRWQRLTEQPGSVVAAQSLDLHSRISGYISKLTVDIGSRVKKGELLAEVDDPELSIVAEKASAEKGRAIARFEKAQAAVSVSQAGADAAEAKVQAAKFAVEAANSSLEFQKKQFTRMRELGAKGDIEQRVVEEADSRYQSASSATKTVRAQLLVAEAALLEARASLSQSKTGPAEARSELMIANAGLRGAEITFGYKRIAAPFDGVVTRRNFHVGDLVHSATAGNESPLFTVVQTSVMRFEVEVPENDTPYLDPGDPVKIQIDALGTRGAFQGQIARTAFAIDPKTRTLRAEVDLPNPDGRLRPGLFGKVAIELESKENALMIPLSALIGTNHLGGTAVCFRVVDNRAVRTVISVGNLINGPVDVLEGLAEGNVVIANPDAKMRDGQAVTIRKNGD